MDIKQLRKAIKGLPGDMKIVVQDLYGPWREPTISEVKVCKWELFNLCSDGSDEPRYYDDEERPDDAKKLKKQDRVLKIVPCWD